MESSYTHTREKPSQVSQETCNDLNSKEKSAARVDPKPSHDPRNPRKADLRRETDAWSLLVWAYKDECVRAAAGGTEDWSLRHERSSLCMAERRGGLINGWLQVHEDAVAVDAWVRNLPRNDYWLIVDHAEKGEMPSRVVKLPPLKCRPVMRQTSAGPKPKMLRHPRTHEPYICLIEFVGYSVEEISKAHAEADARVDRLGDCLIALHDRMVEKGQPLVKWLIREPWAGFLPKQKKAA
ncbi:hypothetical protein FHS85_001763 [Rhodoligotrophos appendicifer]|uniref:hypothetical protein n=1 Tax=Rhodoligotrophos appendicifer TaxID=987056 RepID=UPI001186E116|nr:hypothetical protein [Rhodoligotrophos appendicifer]